MAWYNSNFGYIHHIAKRCGTADEAYRQVEGCLENREMAVREADLGRRRQALKRRQLHEQLNGLEIGSVVYDEVQLELEALALHDEVTERNYKQCVEEVAFLRNLLVELLPHCEYVGKVADKDHAYQLAQRKEWFVRNLNNAHTQLLSNGRIDTATMEQIKLHPDVNLISDIVETMVVAANRGQLTLGSVNDYIQALPLPKHLFIEGEKNDARD